MVCSRCMLTNQRLARTGNTRPFSQINCDVGQKSVMRTIRKKVLDFLAEIVDGQQETSRNVEAAFTRVCINFFMHKVVGDNPDMQVPKVGEIMCIMRLFLDCQGDDTFSSTASLILGNNRGKRGQRRKQTQLIFNVAYKCPFTNFSLSQLKCLKTQAASYRDILLTFLKTLRIDVETLFAG